MKRLLLLAMIALPYTVWATPCPTSVPGSYPGTQGSATPSAISGTSCTNKGVTTASIDVIWGIPYKTTVGYVAPSGSNQSSQDLMWVGPHECETTPNNCEIIFYWHGGGGYSGTNGETGAGSP